MKDTCALPTTCHHLHEASVFFDGGTISGWILWDLDGLFHGSQQTITTLSSQGRAETLWPTNEQTNHNIGVLFHAFSCKDQVDEQWAEIIYGSRSWVLVVLTIDKDSKTEEVQVSLPPYWVPSNIRVALGQQHWTHLKPASCQVGHNLHHKQTLLITKSKSNNCVSLCESFPLTISRSCSCKAKASSLLSMQEAAATSRGVDPRIPANVK